MAGRFRTVLAAYVIMLAIKIAGKQTDRFKSASSLSMVLLLKHAAPERVFDREPEIMAKLKELSESDK